jgi:heme exporter protein C
MRQTVESTPANPKSPIQDPVSRVVKQPLVYAISENQLDAGNARFGMPLVACYTVTCLLGLIVAVYLAAFYAPTEATMGVIQKVFYVHLPLAINTFVAAVVVFVASIGYLSQRTTWWDDLAAAAAKVAVLLCGGVLLTGMIWGKCAWGQWWTWSPRLTFSLMLWLLYVVYVMLRGSIESPQRRAIVSAVYGVIAFLDVPLVYLSARLMPDIHPGSIALDSQMKLTLLFWFVPVTLISLGLMAARYRLNRRVRWLEMAAPKARSAAMNVRLSGGVV